MKKAPEDTKFIVYLHVHRDSGMGYVGVTGNTMEKRWKQHVVTAKAAKGKGSSLQGAIRLYGPDAFDHYVLEENVSAGEIAEAERYWVIEKGTLDPYGYNLCEGGDGSCGYVYTEDERARTAANTKKMWESQEHRAKTLPKLKEAQNRPEVKEASAARARKMWEVKEYRDKTTNKVKEAKNRPEAKASVSAFQKEYQNRPDVKAQASARLTKMWMDSEYRAKTLPKLKEAQNRPEVKARASANSAEIWKDQEHRFLITDIMKVAGPIKGRYRGVYFSRHRNKFMFQIKSKGKIKRKRFQTEEQAARAYDDLARKHFGPGCFLNFPTDQEREDWLALKASLAEKRK
jgi:hypothetical protein